MIMVFRRFEDHGVLRIWDCCILKIWKIVVFWGFEHYGVLRIRELWGFVDLGIIVF